MKMFWAIAGALLLGAAIGALIFSVAKERETEKETSAFVTDTVTAISRYWNPSALRHRAEPGLIRAMQAQGQSMNDLFTVYGQLGALESPPNCVLKSTSQLVGTADSYATASFSCDAQYDKGPGTWLITVRKGSDYAEWKIYYLNLSSPVFAGLK